MGIPREYELGSRLNFSQGKGGIINNSDNPTLFAINSYRQQQLELRAFNDGSVARQGALVVVAVISLVNEDRTTGVSSSAGTE
jgi:hypothetical protein